MMDKEAFFNESEKSERIPFTMPSGQVVWVDEMAQPAFEDLLECRSPDDTEEIIKASVIVRCVVDEAGKAIFGKEDIHRLAHKSRTKILQPLYEICAKINGLDQESREAAKKNSIAAEIGKSPTSLHSGGENLTLAG